MARARFFFRAKPRETAIPPLRSTPATWQSGAQTGCAARGGSMHERAQGHGALWQCQGSAWRSRAPGRRCNVVGPCTTACAPELLAWRAPSAKRDPYPPRGAAPSPPPTRRRPDPAVAAWRRSCCPDRGRGGAHGPSSSARCAHLARARARASSSPQRECLGSRCCSCLAAPPAPRCLSPGGDSTDAPSSSSSGGGGPAGACAAMKRACPNTPSRSAARAPTSPNVRATCARDGRAARPGETRARPTRSVRSAAEHGASRGAAAARARGAAAREGRGNEKGGAGQRELSLPRSAPPALGGRTRRLCPPRPLSSARYGRDGAARHHRSSSFCFSPLRSRRASTSPAAHGARGRARAPTRPGARRDEAQLV